MLRNRCNQFAAILHRMAPAGRLLMRRRTVIIGGAAAVGLLTVVGLAIVVANSVSTQPSPAYVSRHLRAAVNHDPADDPLTSTGADHGGTDQPATHDAGQDHTGEPTTTTHEKSGTDGPTIREIGDDHGGDPGDGGTAALDDSSTMKTATSTVTRSMVATSVDDHGRGVDDHNGHGGR
jgi:hypothetical protein